MNRNQLKEIIRELMQEVLDDETLMQEETLDERNAENKAKKAAWQQKFGQQAIDRRNKQFTAQGSSAQLSQDPKSQLQTGRHLSQPLPTNPRQDILKTRSAEFGPRKGQGLDPLPTDVRAKVALGGKVIFGKYFDSAGTFLGSVKQGKWTPAGKGNQQGTLEEGKSKTIRLTTLLNESMAEHRINLVRVQTIMEKLYPELTDTQSKKLMEICTEVHMMASQLNMTPYIRTESSLVEWSLLVTGFKTKLNELKEEVTKVCEDKKINPATVVKAIDEVLSY